METATAERASLLLVDDDEAVRDALAAQLSGEGFSVTSCADGPSSLPFLRQQSFAAVISDQRMPGMSGLELLAHARELQPAASRILITGVLSTETLIGAINHGEIHRFLAKPWTRAELIATVQNAVLRHRLAMANAELQAENARLTAQLAAVNAEAQRLTATLSEQTELLADVRESAMSGAERARGACFHLIANFSPLLAKRTQAAVDLCRALAETGSFSAEETESFLAAAWLHGSGLIGLPLATVERFLSAPQDCSSEDRAYLHEHPVRAQAVAAFVDSTLAAGRVLRGHRERWDGRGYPDGVVGAHVPWLARCLAVAVGFVETGAPRAAALAFVEDGSGSAFDPDAVRLLQRAALRIELPSLVREVSLRELRPGMRLARSFSSPAGLLLLPEGHEITPAIVEKLRAATAPATTKRLLVYC